MIVRGIFIISLLIAGQTRAAETPAFGTFVGTVSHTALTRDQLITIELLTVREEGGNLRLRALLTLQFGGFDSAEYITYHYQDVVFNLLSGALAFHQTDQEVFITGAIVRGNELTGELHSAAGLIGPIRLSTDAPIRPTQPLLEPLGGEYKGHCGKTPASLQLFTYSSTQDTHRIGNLFGSYEVKGQLAKVDPGFCGKGLCVYTKIQSASYDFLSGNLVLNGYPYSQRCRVVGSEIQCDECRLRRASSEMIRPSLAPEKYPSQPIDQVKTGLKRNPRASISGQYIGLVCHERLGVLQPVRIDLSTFRKNGNSSLFVSVAAKLYFGNLESETISYRYDPIEYPNPLNKPRFILARPEADLDAIIHVTDIREGVIEGHWYSSIFGRVGTFVATQNRDLPVVPSAKLFPTVSGVFNEANNKDGVRVDLVVAPGNAPLGTDNPFYPLNLSGNVWWQSGIIKKEEIQGGSFDFYTGRIAFVYGKENLITGTLIPGQPPRFRRLGGGFGTLMQPFEPAIFDRIN